MNALQVQAVFRGDLQGRQTDADDGDGEGRTPPLGILEAVHEAREEPVAHLHPERLGGQRGHHHLVGPSGVCPPPFQEPEPVQGRSELGVDRRDEVDRPTAAVAGVVVGLDQLTVAVEDRHRSGGEAGSSGDPRPDPNLVDHRAGRGLFGRALQDDRAVHGSRLVAEVAVRAVGPVPGGGRRHGRPRGQPHERAEGQPRRPGATGVGPHAVRDGGQAALDAHSERRTVPGRVRAWRPAASVPTRAARTRVARTSAPISQTVVTGSGTTPRSSA